MTKRPVLLIHFGAPTALLTLLPILESLHHGLDHLEIHILTTAVGAELFFGHPLVHHIYTCPTSGLKQVENWWKLLKALQQIPFHLALVVDTQFISAFLTFLLRIPIRIGYRSFWNSLLLTHLVPAFHSVVNHMWFSAAFLLRPLGIVPHTNTGTLSELAPIKEEVHTLFSTQLLTKQPRIAVYLDPLDPPLFSKEILPPTLQQIEALHSFSMVYCGPPGMSLPVTHSEENSQLNLIGKTGIKRLIAVLRECDYVITASYTISLLASVLDKPVLFFSEKSRFSITQWGPFGPYFEIYTHQKQGQRYSFFEHFLLLVSSVKRQEIMTPMQQRKKREKSAFQIQYWQWKTESETTVSETIEKLCTQGFSISALPVPLTPASFFRALKDAKKEKRTVIQCSQFPPGMFWLMTFLLPKHTRFVRLPFHPYISANDYLQFYATAELEK